MWEVCAVQQDTFYPHHGYEQVSFYKKSRLYINGRSLRDGKVTNYLQLAQKRNLSTKISKKLFFCQHSQTLYYVRQNQIENLEFVLGVNFEIIDSLKNNGTKYLLIFDDSCEEICNSKTLVDVATAGIHRRLSTIYIKHNLFHQSKLGRDLELQITHIVLLKSPRDVMQVSTLSSHFVLGSELVHWYRHVTSVTYGHLLIDLSPRIDDRLRYSKHRIQSPKILYPGPAKTVKKFGL